MANEKQLKILQQGVEAWNEWRSRNIHSAVDLDLIELPGADLSGINLSRAHLKRANLGSAILRKACLRGAQLTGAILSHADLAEADVSWADLKGACLPMTNFTSALLNKSDLSNAQLSGANLVYSFLQDAKFIGTDLSHVSLMWANATQANFRDARLTEAILSGAIFRDTNLENADLSGADLMFAQFVGTNFSRANLTGCRVYGTSAWNVDFREVRQEDLIITDHGEPIITVDNLEVAQFVYLLLKNEKIRDVIDTIGKKGVLILGRFKPDERKQVLDAIRARLREMGFVPMMFDFEKPDQRDFTETIKTLAGLSLFIIADITNPRCSPLELQATVPDYMIHCVPILQEDEPPFGMFRDLQKFPWVLDLLKYDSGDNLIEVLEEAVVLPAIKKADELQWLKAQGTKERHVRDYSGVS